MELKHIVIAVIGIAVAVVIGFAWMEVNESIMQEGNFIVDAIESMLETVTLRANALITPTP